MGNETVNRNDLPKQNAEVAQFRSILVCPFPVTVTSMPGLDRYPSMTGWNVVVTPVIRPYDRCQVGTIRDMRLGTGLPVESVPSQLVQSTVLYLPRV